MYRYQITIDPRVAKSVWDVQDFAVQQGQSRGWSDVKVSSGLVAFTSASRIDQVESDLLAAFPRIAKGLSVARKPVRNAKLLKGLYGLNKVPAVSQHG